MAHVLIVGTTESGKSLLAKALVASWAAKGYACLVLDPVVSRWPGAAYQTDDPEEYLAELSRWKRCLLVIDEAGEAIGRYAGAMTWVATRSRHDGHTACFVVQRAALLDRTVRAQCRYLALFACDGYDARILAREWPQGGFERGAELKQFEYLWGSRFGGCAKMGNVKIPIDEKQPDVLSLEADATAQPEREDAETADADAEAGNEMEQGT